MDEPSVAIIIVNWNGLNDTIECLNSLKQISYSNYEIIVVDNGSEGSDADIIEQMFTDYVKVIRNTENYGCGRGYNIGINYVLANSKPDYVMVMNNDLIVDTLFLSELINASEQDSTIGIAGPKFFYHEYNGRKDILWSVGGKTSLWSPRMNVMLGQGVSDSTKYSQIANRDWVSGAILLLKRSLIETIGTFNPWYFFSMEDVEYCLTAWKNGFRVIFVPKSKAWHKINASAKRLSVTYSCTSHYYYFIKQNFPLYIYIFHLLWLPATQSLWIFRHLYSYRDKNAFKKYLLDLLDFLNGNKTQNAWRRKS